MSTGEAARLTAIGASVNAFAQSAAAGHFAVNETGGQALLSAIRRMLKWVEANQADLQRLEQQPKLGTSTNAAVMKPYLQHVATDHMGFLTQVRAFAASLQAAEEAVLTAMRNYVGTDGAEAIRLASGEDS